MLNEKHMELIDELKGFANKMDSLFTSCEDSCTYEEDRANNIIKYLTNEISEAVDELEHLNRQVKEGVLLLNSQGRYNLDSMPEMYFTCGDIIELMDEDVWYRGRIEHDNKDYYFCNYEGDNITLREGIKARIRVDKA